MQPDVIEPRKTRLSAEELRQLLARTGVDQVIHTSEAAELLGVSPQTMRRWACEGSGPIRPRKVAGRLRWSVAEIQSLLSGAAPVASSAA